MLNIIDVYIEFNIFGVLNIFAALLNISLGVFIFAKNPKSRVNQSFFLVTFASLIWLMSFGFHSIIIPLDIAKKFSYGAYFFGVPFISPSVYMFSSAWIKRTDQYKWAYLGYALAIPIMIRFVFFGDSLYATSQFSWGRYADFYLTPINIIYLIFVLSHLFIYGLLAVRNFYIGWKSSTNKTEKIQFRNILISYLIAYTGSVDFIRGIGYNVFPIGCISITIYISIIAYTIIRHQFLDINLVIKRLSAVLVIYISLILILVPVSYPILGQILKQPSSTVPSLIFLFAIGIGVFFSLGPIIYAYLVRHSFWLRGHMTTGLTHELKSPLSSIQSATDIISTHLENPDLSREKVYEYLNMIRTNTSRLETSVKDLLNVSKIQDGEIEINRKNFDLKPMLNELKTAYMPLILKKGLKLTIETNDVETLFADEEKIKQVVSNLLSNAIKFSEKGEIRVEFKREEDQIIGSVSDQGKGIDKKDLPRIFDRFYQGKNAVKGSGVGLTIAKAWIEAHGGKIWSINKNRLYKTTIIFKI